MPKDACDPVSDIYLIASSDLIGKYYWMSFFGSWNEQTQSGNGRNFIQLSYSGQSAQNLPTYGNGIITLMEQNNQLVAVINVPQQGIRNMFVKDIVYYRNGQEIYSQINNTSNNTLDSMLWIDPSFGMVIFMDESIKNSVFTNLFFFNGNGISQFDISKLSHFELVYGNSEVKVFKLIV